MGGIYLEEDYDAEEDDLSNDDFMDDYEDEDFTDDEEDESDEGED